MAETIKSFPNIPVSHWLSLRTQFKRTIPGTITTNYLASVLKMTEPSAKANILPTLRQIGLIDADNKTNQDLAKQLRDDSSYPQFCKAILKKNYPQELLDAFPDKDSGRGQIKIWFMNHSGIGNSAATRIAAFYIALLEANPTASTTLTKTKVKESSEESQKEIVRRTKTSQKGIPKSKSESETSPTAHQDGKKSNGPDLNINIQIHISSDASSDQIRSIFENMAKYIYKEKSE